jgi:hypothetical protein
VEEPLSARAELAKAGGRAQARAVDRDSGSAWDGLTTISKITK